MRITLTTASLNCRSEPDPQATLVATFYHPTSLALAEQTTAESDKANHATQEFEWRKVFLDARYIEDGAELNGGKPMYFKVVRKAAAKQLGASGGK